VVCEARSEAHLIEMHERLRVQTVHLQHIGRGELGASHHLQDADVQLPREPKITRLVLHVRLEDAYATTHEMRRGVRRGARRGTR